VGGLKDSRTHSTDKPIAVYCEFAPISVKLLGLGGRLVSLNWLTSQASFVMTEGCRVAEVLRLYAIHGMKWVVHEETYRLRFFFGLRFLLTLALGVN
jgi:hypothetical protein